MFTVLHKTFRIKHVRNSYGPQVTVQYSLYLLRGIRSIGDHELFENKQEISLAIKSVNKWKFSWLPWYTKDTRMTVFEILCYSFNCLKTCLWIFPWNGQKSFVAMIAFTLKLELMKFVIQESIWKWIGGSVRFTTVQYFYNSFEFGGLINIEFFQFCTFYAYSIIL